MTASTRARPAAAPGTAERNRRTIRRACRCFRRSRWRMSAPMRSSPKCSVRTMRRSFAKLSAPRCSTTRRWLSRPCSWPWRPFSRVRRSSIPTAASMTPGCGMRPHSATGSCADWPHSMIRRAAIARAVTRAPCATAHFRSSRTSAMPPSACRAMGPFPRTLIGVTTIWDCAVRCAGIWRIKRNTADCSARLPCATRRPAGFTSITACCIAWKTWCDSTPNGIPGRGAGIREARRESR
jgi:hypothetical protein